MKKDIYNKLGLNHPKDWFEFPQFDSIEGFFDKFFFTLVSAIFIKNSDLIKEALIILSIYMVIRTIIVFFSINNRYKRLTAIFSNNHLRS